MPDRERAMARTIAQAVAEQGGRCYYVGGCVRDELRGIATKDVDLEVHGVSPDALASLLDGLGRRLRMGASFGVYALQGYALDIAMPRRERACGRGHRDFEVDVDPYIGTRAAARRRDFTVNALMRDVLSGELIDHFGGCDDLRRGVLRHVNDASFGEDPLRVLRAAQFAARFGFTVAPETLALCRRMDLTALSRERVLGELEKALLQAPRPSVFFAVLREMEQLDAWFPELSALCASPPPAGEDASRLPAERSASPTSVASLPSALFSGEAASRPVAEGSRVSTSSASPHPASCGSSHPDAAWDRSMRILDAAASLRERAQHPLTFMLAALCCELDSSAPVGESIPPSPEHAVPRAQGLSALSAQESFAPQSAPAGLCTPEPAPRQAGESPLRGAGQRADEGRVTALQNPEGGARDPAPARPFPGDPARSARLAQRLLERLSSETKLLRDVPQLVRLHRRALLLLAEGADATEFAELFDAVTCPEDLLLLSLATLAALPDANAGHEETGALSRAAPGETACSTRIAGDGAEAPGAPASIPVAPSVPASGEEPAAQAPAEGTLRPAAARDVSAVEARLRADLEEYRRRLALPAVTGADLLAAGMKPGKALGDALRYAHHLRLAGIPRDRALPQTLARLQSHASSP